MKELTVKKLRRNLLRGLHEVDELNRAARRSGGEEDMKYSFEDYRQALEGAGPKFKELVLDRAAKDINNIGFLELKQLVDFAYPESV